MEEVIAYPEQAVKWRNLMENKETSSSPAKVPRLPFPSKDLALLWRIPFSTETELERVEFALRERIKELNCLYGISQLAERYLYSLALFMAVSGNHLRPRLL
jgi:hypothetical protein